MQEKVICPTCHQVHTLPTYYSTCQYCNKMISDHELFHTKSKVSICSSCQLERNCIRKLEGGTDE